MKIVIFTLIIFGLIIFGIDYFILNLHEKDTAFDICGKQPTVDHYNCSKTHEGDQTAIQICQNQAFADYYSCLLTHETVSMDTCQKQAKIDHYNCSKTHEGDRTTIHTCQKQAKVDWENCPKTIRDKGEYQSSQDNLFFRKSLESKSTIICTEASNMLYCLENKIPLDECFSPYIPAAVHRKIINALEQVDANGTIDRCTRRKYIPGINKNLFKSALIYVEDMQ